MLIRELRKAGDARWADEVTKTKYDDDDDYGDGDYNDYDNDDGGDGDILEWEKLREKENGSLNGRVWEFPR
ncbi:unnamed protein product [Litomosoides sigmodontis]|uniref:Uncharacterized protein n=1 Tax=Litomosoides sigmodontis TaxID=42156 RepID=A0A3P6SJK3_LITSI|nr:unnamed protein product [Litomosoides sigmodontis]